MEVKMSEQEYSETKSQETKIPEINTQPGNITKLQPPVQSQEQWLKYGQQVSEFLGTLPTYLGVFFSQYKQPIVSLSLVVTALITVKILLAVLDSLNDIPLISPTFELIGIGYSTWFIYRYLLRASSRQELTQEINTIKSQLLGNQTPKS
jgi:hypothetical protein